MAPCPWHLLSVNLTDALFHIGLRFPNLRKDVNHEFSRYLHTCQDSSTKVLQWSKDQRAGIKIVVKTRALHDTFAYVTSLLGFLEAAANQAIFWTAEERHNVLSILGGILADDLLLSVDAAFSAIRNLEQNNFALTTLALFEETYDAVQEPIGALAVKYAYQRLVERCAALMVVSNSAIEKHDILPSLLASTSSALPQPLNALLWETVADASIQQLTDLDEGSDYIQLGSVSQQTCAQALKARCLTSYLCCIMADEDAGDIDLLLSWLEKIISEPTQSTNDTLVCAALQCLARLSKMSSDIASSLTRSLPHMIIHRTLSEKAGETAAETLLYVLKLLSQDAVITTIWGLGNSLSSSPRDAEKANGFVHGSVSQDTASYNSYDGALKTGSTSSLVENGKSSSTNSPQLVILAIIAVARGSNDTKITALATSLLIQKVGKITKDVDLAIIRRVAELGNVSGATEFKTLLRFYDRLILEGIAGGRDDILRAVSSDSSSRMFV